MKKITLLLLITLDLILVTNSFGQQTTIDSLKQVVATAKQDTNQVKRLNTLAIKYQRINLDTSLIYAKQSLKFALQLNYKIGEAKAYSSIGSVHYYQSNYKKTLKYWLKAMILNEELGNKSGLSANIGNIGTVYYLQDNYDKALNFNYKSLEIDKINGDMKGVAMSYNNIGNIYSDQGNFTKALEYYYKSIEIKKTLKDKKGISSSYDNIGIIFLYQGSYDKAMTYYKKSLDISENIENKEGVMNCNNNIGLLYAEQGNYDKALEFYNKSFKIAKEINYKIGLSNSYNNIGIIYKEQGDYEKALKYYFKALDIDKRLDDKNGMGWCYNNIGVAYYLQKDYIKSLSNFNKSLSIAKTIGDNHGIAKLYVNFSELHLSIANTSLNNHIKKNELDTAIYYSNKALELKTGMSIISFHEYIILSISYWALNKTKLAKINYNNFINIDNENILMNFSFISEKNKELFFETIKEHYWKYNSFVLQNINSFPDMVEQVYNNTVKNKGLLLKSNTAMRNAIYSSNDSKLMQDYDNWIILKRQIAKKYSNGENAIILENKADSLEGYLVKNSNEFSDFKKTQNISWKQVQASLKENEVAIEFTHFPLLNPDSSYMEFTNQTQYVALILTKNSKPKMIPLFKEKQLEEIIGKFGGNNYSYINSIYGKNTAVNTELYNLVWKPMEESLKGAKKVYLSPSGLLHKISFSAIAKEQNIYLCDAYDIEVKSSTGKITEQKNRNQQMNTATLFGGITYDTDSTTQKIWSYLEGTKIETQKIDKILKKGKIEVDYFSNTTATEEEFKLMASNSNILHIATHGFFYPDPQEVQEETEKNIEVGEITFRGGNRGFGLSSFVENDNPLMRSGLVFAGANDVWSIQNKNDSIDDGVLTAQEVSNIDMRKTDLVVMSACETGLGDIKGSEGVYGLQRAFKMAGVNFMIMSLWQVPDKETEEFMTSFYKKLIKYKDIKKAFAETQKEMRIKYDPYFWAAFVLIE